MKNVKFAVEFITIFICGYLTGVLLLIGVQKFISKEAINELQLDKIYYFILEDKKGNEVFSVQYYPSNKC